MNKTIKVVIGIAILCAVAVAGYYGYNAGKEEEVAKNELFAMDTHMVFTVYGENGDEIIADSMDEVVNLENQLSTNIASSQVGKINSEGQGILKKDGAILMEKSILLNKQTDGLFNPAIYPVVEAWGFTKEEYRVPSQSELDALLPITKIQDVNYDKSTGQVTFNKEGMAIDFGAIAKGYTSSKVIKMFKDAGVKSAIINLGGNVQTLGTKPNGEKWRVGIQHPEISDGYLGIIDIEDKAVITSGGYERFFEEGGKKYHHIIDPRTGSPAESGIESATIVADDGTLADGLSTSLFIMGKEKAIKFWRNSDLDFQFILYTKDGKLLVSEGIADDFTSDTAPIEIIKKK